MDNIILTKDFEEQYFRKVLALIDDKCERYRKDVMQLRADIEEMRIHFHEGDTELWVSINNAITMHDQEERSLTRSLRSLAKPYFGRIVYTDEATGKRESLYIGRSGISEGPTEQLVADWRAPISNVYYENGIGKCTFLSPDGDDINLDLELKRTFDIEPGKLVGYMDSEAVSNDELLTKYLSRNKQAVLGEIVATIQKEQNDIIRRSPIHNVLVQGAAGSGKTTVAMHRISYILYNFAERIKPEQFYIIGSNKMLLNYITGVLPELDVEGVKQMTMEELFTKLFYEQWDPESCRIIDPRAERGYCGTEYFEKLVSFCDRLVNKYFRQDDIVLNRDCFVEGIKDGKGGVYDRSEERGTADYNETGEDALGRSIPRYKGYKSCVKLLGGDYARKYIKDNPAMPIMDLSRELNEKLTDNLEYELSVGGYGYTEKEKNAIRKEFACIFGKKKFPMTVYQLYDMFLKETGSSLVGVRDYDVYDLASLAYINRRVFGADEEVTAHHIIIDEAQDYGMMAYRTLKYCVKACTYTIMGDTSQNIRYESGINNWSEMRELFLSREGDSFSTLRKSYRNTVEISNFATGILEHGDFEIYPVEPIIRHGAEPKLMEAGSENEAFAKLKAECEKWQSEGHNTIAIVCRTDEEAAALHEKLRNCGIELLDNDPENMKFDNGILVLPVRLTKGLEFDAVLIWDPTREKYPSDNMHAKLLYVAATRALHELSIISLGNLTGLIADKVSETKVRNFVIADPVIVTEGPSAGEIVRKNIRDRERELEYEKSKIMASVTERMEKKIATGDVKTATQSTDNRTSGVPARGAAQAGSAKSGSAGRAGSAVSGSAAQTGSAISGSAGRTGSAVSGSAGRAGSAVSGSAGPFATMVHDQFITPPGHQNIALSTKWVTKQKDGIYIQNKLGILRLCPIGTGVIRVTYVRGVAFKCEQDALVPRFNMLKNFEMKENPKTIEMSLGKLNISFDKQVGAITYKDEKKRELMKEKVLEPRIILGEGSRTIGYTNFMPKKDVTFHALNPIDGNFKYIGNTAMYVSIGEVGNTDTEGIFPLILVKDSFAILPVSNDLVGFNNLPAKGTSLITFGEGIDFYFIKADTTEELVSYYKKLTGQR